MASNFYRSHDAPRYILGHSLELGFICAGMIAVVILMTSYIRINAKRDRLLAEGSEGSYTNKELSELGDRAITFRYML
jgi:hypothetical protein